MSTFGMDLFADSPLDDSDIGGVRKGITRESQVRPTSQKVSKPAMVAWRRWCEASARPSVGEPPTDFARTVDKLIASGCDLGKVASRIDLAVFIPPYLRGDPKDTKRVITVIKGGAKERAARSAKKRGDPKWMYGEARLRTELSVFVAMLDGPDLVSLPEGELIIADELCRKFSEDRLQEKVNKVIHAGGSGIIRPSDVKRGRRLFIKGDSAKPTSVGTAASGYQSGSSELQEDGSDATIYLDREAENMLLSGVPRAKVSQFHNDVPEGFWDSVVGLLSIHKNVPSSVRQAEADFGFSLDTREKKGINVV